MRVHVEPSGRRIRPFNDAPGETPIRNRPLSDWQAEMFRDAGLEPVDRPEPPCLVVPDTLYGTAEVLRQFVDGAAGRNAVLVLADSLFGRQTTPVQPHVEAVEGGWRFEKIRFVAGGAVAPVDVVIDPDEQVRTIELPARYVDEPMEFAMPRFPVLTLHHWVHVLWANQIAGLVGMRNTPRWRVALSGFKAGLRARSLNRWKILGRCNRIGRDCDIHPSAVVELSTLGDGVTVGPHARIFASTIGDGAVISTAAQVEASTIGERAFVAQASCLRFCVLYPESIAGFAMMQQSILGRRVITTLGSGTIDLNFEREIRVVLDGKLHSTGSRFVGSAFGHDCRIGTRVTIAAGREIPNGYTIVGGPESTIHHIPEDLADAGPLINDGGTLRPAG